jgi:acyl-coenzyme A thioesterase 9
VRRKSAAVSLFTTPPDAEESRLLHAEYVKAIEEHLQDGADIESAVHADGSVFMDETRVSHVEVCHPEMKNVHNKIFGGTLMRYAYETAWATAFMHW